MGESTRKSGMVWSHRLPSSIKDLTSGLRPCSNRWCTGQTHLKDKLCAACQEITSGVFVENMLIHLCWNPKTWRLRVSLSATELMWCASGTWDFQTVPGSPFPLVAKAKAVSKFALGGRLLCHLPAGAYSVSWRVSRSPTADELEKANEAHSVWGLRHSPDSCFAWPESSLESRMRFCTSRGWGQIQVRGLNISAETVGMLPAWTEIAVGIVHLTDPEEDGLCSMTMEVELHGNCAQPKRGLYVDGVVVSQLRETSSKKSFRDASRVIREANVTSNI